MKEEDSFLRKPPPNDINLERGIIGGLLLSPSSLGRAREVLGRAGARVFYNSELALIYTALLKMEEQGKPIEELTLKRFIKRTFRKEISASFLADLPYMPEGALEYQLRELKELSLRRETLEEGLKTIQAVKDEVDLQQIKQENLEFWNKVKTIDEKKGMTALESLNAPVTENPSPIDGGILAGGRFTIVGAKDGEGKTLLMLQLTLCAITGTPFLGRFRIKKPAKVLYFCGENPQDDINDKLRKQIPRLESLLGRKIKGDLERHFILVYPGDFEFLLDKRKERPLLSAWLEKYRPDIVIFDPLNDFISGQKSLNDDTIARETGKFLNKLARDFSCYPILTTHLKKGTKDNQGNPKPIDEENVFEEFHGSKYWTNLAINQIAIIRAYEKQTPLAKKIVFKCKTVSEISAMLMLRLELGCGKTTAWELYKVAKDKSLIGLKRGILYIPTAKQQNLNLGTEKKRDKNK